MAETNPQNEENQPGENKPATPGAETTPGAAASNKAGNGSGSAEKPEGGAKPAAPAKPAAGAAPAAKPAPKPAAKPKEEKKPLIDNGDGTITDPNTGLMWKKTDAWLDTKRFYTWAQAPEYVEKINKEKFAGHDDWRIPSKAEAETLVDKTKKNVDKNGIEYPFDPIFDMGAAAVTWITECSQEKVVRFDYKIGSDFTYPPAEIWSSIRLVRDAEGYEEVRKQLKEGGAKPAAKPAPKPAAAAAKPGAPAAKPAAPGGAGAAPAGAAKPESKPADPPQQ